MSESLAEKPPCSADLCVFFWRWRDADFLSAPWFAHSCIGRSRERERERGGCWEFPACRGCFGSVVFKYGLLFTARCSGGRGRNGAQNMREREE